MENMISITWISFGGYHL